MKKLHLQFFWIFCLAWLSLPMLAQDQIDFTIRYNTSSNEYEVYGRPDFSQNDIFTGGGSQISVLLPATVGDAPLAVTSVNGGPWTDNSQIYAPAAAPSYDFHGIATNGTMPVIDYFMGMEVLLFTFTMPENCEDGVRLFENASDPQSTVPSMLGGDFNNYFANALTYYDYYNANYDNAGIDCNTDSDGDGYTDEEEMTGVDDPDTPNDPMGQTSDPNNPCDPDITVNGQYPLPIAFAGSDTLMCGDLPGINLANLNQIPTAQHGSIIWTSDDPNGSFDDPSIAAPVYTFGNTNVGQVILRMTVLTDGPCGTFDIDEVVVGLNGCDPSDPLPSTPIIFLGSDPDIVDPCHCLNNAAVNELQSGQFDELVSIEAPTGQTWTIVNDSRLIDENTPEPPAAPDFLPIGTPIVETAPGSGLYELPCRHQDELGFFVIAENEFGQQVSIGATCYYPEIVFTELVPDFLCESANPIDLTPEFVDEINGGIAEGGVWFEVNGQAATQLDPNTIGFGTHTITAYFDAGEGALFDNTDPGCVQPIQQEFTVSEPGTTNFACNDLVNVSLGGNCEAFLDLDIFLEDASIACEGNFEVNYTDNQGATFPNPVTAAHIGQTIMATITELSTGNSCWSSVFIEDKLGPNFDCNSNPIELACTDDPSLVPAPVAVDACTATEVHLINEIINEDNACSLVEIVRTFIAFDEFGNESEPCNQIIRILPPTQVDFPADIAWSCEQYADFNNITDATVVDTFALGCTGLLTNADLGNAIDATVLSNNCLTNTGSGMPDVAMGTYCNFAVSMEDDTIFTCGSSFKILRTWTVVNWCNGQIYTDDADGDDNLQIIKVVDIVAPTIVQTEITVNANLAGTHPQACRSTETLPAATIADNCSEIAEVQIFTPVGTIFGNGGAIPEPGLEVGVHTVTYQATDECGNISELNVTLNVIDDVTPTAVCDEITNVSISTDGLAVVDAITFDDGSNDNCGIDYFEVRRMTDNCGIAGNTAFNENVTFCCADVGQEVMVVLRVYDYYDNFAECMVLVEVEDKLPPYKLQDVDNQTIDCGIYYNNIETTLDLAEANNETDPAILNTLFSRPVYADNCDTIVNHSYIRDINSCGEGTITRTWNVMDTQGNNGPTCTQIITVTHVNDWEVAFPEDVTIECSADNPSAEDAFGQPQVFFDDCELIAYAQEDLVFNVVQDACYEIIRTWTLINWCVYNGTDLDDDITINAAQRRFKDGTDGIIKYQQIIRVVDEVAPVITCPTIEDYAVNNDCLADITLPFLADTTDCSPNVNVQVSLLDADGNVIGLGYTHSDLAPAAYSALYTATDNCGNSSSCTVAFNVVDNKAPTPYCTSGLVVELMGVDTNNDGTIDQGMVDLWASDFDAGSFDNCSEVSLTVWVNANNYAGSQTLGYEDAAELNGSLPISCDSPFTWNFGFNTIYLYVTDASGNMDFCVTNLVIESNPNVPACPAVPSEDPIIAGQVYTELGEAVSDVEMLLNGNANTMTTTEETGDYEFNVQAGSDYSVIPHLDSNPLNGVTTYDLVLIRQHILTTNPLNSPYQLIAADVNNSGTITTYDVVQLRQLILFVVDEMPNNTSWRFVDADYVFPEATNPWSTQFDELISLNNLSQDELNTDFVGVKIGDVNGSVQANATAGTTEERSTGEVIFQTENLDLTAGEEYEITLDANREVLGYQFTLDFDQNAIEFIEITETENTTTAENFGLAKLDKGAITTSWNKHSDSKVPNTTIRFKALINSQLSDVIEVNSRYTKAEAYDQNGDQLDVQLGFGEASSEITFELLQNKPNPFREQTTIGFYLPTASSADLTIHDASGALLKRVEGDFAKGYNEVTIKRKDLGANKVLFYTLKTPTHTATQSMIVVE